MSTGAEPAVGGLVVVLLLLLTGVPWPARPACVAAVVLDVTLLPPIPLAPVLLLLLLL